MQNRPDSQVGSTKRRRRILDATAQAPRELTRERGPRLEREALTASIGELCIARKIARIEAGVGG